MTCKLALRVLNLTLNSVGAEILQSCLLGTFHFMPAGLEKAKVPLSQLR